MGADGALARKSERLLEAAFPTPSGKAFEAFRRDVKGARASMGAEIQCVIGSDGVSCRFPFASSIKERTWRVRLPTKDGRIRVQPQRGG